MKIAEPQKIRKKHFVFFDSSHLFLALVSLSALIATFAVSVSDFRFETKTAVFLTVVFAYLLIFALIYLRQKQSELAESKTAESVFNSEIENKLLALEEASAFFSASLKPADMFRLVSNRLREMIPFSTAALFLVDDEKSNLKIVGASGENARQLLNLKIDSKQGLAGKSFQSGEIERDEKLFPEKQAIHGEALSNLNSAIAVPLKCGENAVFGVLVLYEIEGEKFNFETETLLAAVAERIAPLFLGSMAFERSLSSALTDPLTSLPNERAFYLILENQIAESQRRRDERPLTILSVDVKDFAGLNQKFGHAAGDRILSFTADTIKEQLRKMDFLARSSSDEFLIVLPTASEITAQEIIGRLNQTFLLNPYTIEQEKIYIKLNFGAATFWQDGETAQELLRTAIIKKRQAKSDQNNKILWFPKEFIN